MARPAGTYNGCGPLHAKLPGVHAQGVKPAERFGVRTLQSAQADLGSQEGPTQLSPASSSVPVQGHHMCMPCMQSPEVPSSAGDDPLSTKGDSPCRPEVEDGGAGKREVSALRALEIGHARRIQGFQRVFLCPLQKGHLAIHRNAAHGKMTDIGLYP